MTESHAELEVAQRYAANLLTPDEAAAFEEHLLTCERCQAEALMSVALRRVARDSSATARRRLPLFATGTLLLAAAIVAILIVPSGIDRELSDLGRVVNPPAYAGVSVRSSPELGDSLFASAMSAYNERRYGDAASGLRAALAAGTDSVSTTFFMASADLMSDRPRDAAAAFGRVIAAGLVASPYLEEAHLYRAHALLQLGRASEAQADLAAVVRMDGAHREAASALARRVTQVSAR